MNIFGKLLKRNSDTNKILLSSSIELQMGALKNKTFSMLSRISIKRDINIIEIVNNDILFATKYRIGKIIYSSKNKLTAIIYSIQRKSSKDNNDLVTKYFAKFTKKQTQSEEYQVSHILNKCQSSRIANFIQYYDRIGFDLFIYEYENNYDSIASIIEKKKDKMNENDIVQLFIKVLFGVLNSLCFLNSKNIIHCNVKPSNILIRNDESELFINNTEIDNFRGKLPVIKLCNFSNSQICTESRKLNEYTSTTIEYLPPESFLLSVFSFKNDIWSLGITLYYLLLNEFPFKYSTKTDIEQEKIIRNAISKELIENKIKSKYSIKVSAMLVNVLCKLLVHSIHLRPTASELLKKFKYSEFSNFFQH